MELEIEKKLSDQKKILVSDFIFNALQDGWKVKKKNDKYIFSKHKGKEKEIFNENFLDDFLKKNFGNDKYM